MDNQRQNTLKKSILCESQSAHQRLGMALMHPELRNSAVNAKATADALAVSSHNHDLAMYGGRQYAAG